MNSISSTSAIEKNRRRIGRAIPLWIAWFILAAVWLPNRAQASDFSTLHEVIRHFQVAFIDRPNLAGLLLGGLDGLKRCAPECEINLKSHPDLFSIRAKNKTVRIPRTAVRDYPSLEQALVKAAELVITQNLVSNQKLLEHAIIRQMVAYCGDPWSVFIEPDLYQRLLDDGSRQMGSLGLLVEPHGLGLRVLDVVSASPAFQAGIRTGVQVDSIAGKAAEGLNELEALALMRGRPGDRVRLVLEGKPYLLGLAPEPKRNIVVDEPSGGIARIHLLNFRPGTGRRLAAVLSKLTRMTRLKGLILDLRGNPGGLVSEGTSVAGLFIKGGKVVSVVNRKQMRAEVEQSPKPGAYRDLSLVVLVDHRSASVSEIVTMALRDYNRAKIVGTKTLGKGTVQVIIELNDGAVLKLSTGRYYSPNGTPLYQGIEPDIECNWDRRGKDIQLSKARRVLKASLHD